MEIFYYPQYSPEWWEAHSKRLTASHAQAIGSNGAGLKTYVRELTRPFFSKAETIIKKILNKINAPYKMKFHITGQSITDFIKDLKNKDKLSLATEIYKQPPIVFYGDDIFFKIMIEDRKQWLF